MTTLSVVQYNVLAEGLSNPEMSPDAGFNSMPPEHMRWAHRGALVLERLIEADADIVCLQEVDHYRDSVEPAMRAAGYAGLYREDEWSPCRANTNGALKDGVALFYRRSKLELVGCHFPFAPRENKNPSDARDAGKSVAARFRVRCADPEIASGPRFGEYVNATETFIACTAHFAAAKTEEGETRRTRQASALFRELKRFRAFCQGEDSFDIGEGRTTDSARVSARDIPIVFAGDLNARPDEPAVRYLKTLGFASAYERVRRDPNPRSRRGRSEPARSNPARRRCASTTSSPRRAWRSSTSRRFPRNATWARRRCPARSTRPTILSERRPRGPPAAAQTSERIGTRDERRVG